MPDLTRQQPIPILAMTDHARLSGADLSGLDLRGLDFASANLQDVRPPEIKDLQK